MKKQRNLKLIFQYLKNDKFRLFLWLFLVIITYIPTLLSSFFWGYAVESLISLNLYKFFLFLALMEFSHILFYSLLSMPRDSLYNYLEIKFSKDVLKDLYTKITEMPAVAFEDIGVGEFINRMTTDPDRVMELLKRLVKMSCRAIVVILVLVIAFKTSYILGVEIIIFSIIMGIISYKFFPKIKKTQEQIKKESDLQVKSATENLTGIREIKALGIKKNIENRIFKNIDRLFFNKKKIRKYEIVYSNLNNLAYFILQTIILATCGYFVVKGELTYAMFIVLESYIWRIDDVVESISDFGVSYSKVKVSLKRINDILNNKLYNDEKFGDINLRNPIGTLEFNNVKFRYKEEEKNVLKGLNLKIDTNKKIAIIGKSGNGKSTIFNLLLRYFDPNEGNITLDGINIKDLTEKSLRNNISIIRQTPFLFNLSILDNFKLVKKNATLDEIRAVCKKSYIDEYIMNLPNKYETIIGEGGVNLSGGQKQRIAIARTLLINTKVILFDEATSALDNESQEYIKQTIDNLILDHTVIVVAHRLSTIVDADVIHVIDNGKLAASGTHKELLNSSGIYRSLYTTESQYSVD
ncbi:MAG TPA: ABC transporter ATP-binding protein [Bacilli bacterium]|nr:ABC transporter ATP-binding protein [Bacilli bacterium]